MKRAVDAELSAALSTARTAFLQACVLDVAVRKPGNVSLASPGHGMLAGMFIGSAHAAAAPLFAEGMRVGTRIEKAQAASWNVAGCNTNLGILLLCAPMAAAVERCALQPAALRQAIEAVLSDLDVADASAAYRAIAAANPGGLGAAASQDVRGVPSVGLRAAMTLAAERDSIARQYRDGFADLFALDLPTCPATVPAVQRLYLGLLSRWPDSHIVRKHGAAVAHSVMHSAQAWRARAEAGEVLDMDPGFAAWDAALKSAGLNPGTTADLTVAALMLAGLAATAAAPA
jgi:triphosphoribosyl-dephospho-CoA synthase